MSVHQHIIQSSLLQGVVSDRIVEERPFIAPSAGNEDDWAVAVGGAQEGAFPALGALLGLSTAHISPPHWTTVLYGHRGDAFGQRTHVNGAMPILPVDASPLPLPIGLHDDPLRNITSIESPNATLWRYTVNDGGGSVTIWAGASLIQVKRPPKNELLRVTGKGIGGSRSYISGFSQGSRLRLMRLLATLRRDCVPIFITLTYPSVWPDTPQEWKRHLDTLTKRLRRRFPDCAMVWKLEAQRRGAPHFHCLLYGVYQVPDGFREWLSDSWYTIVGSGDERHLRAGSRVEYLRSYRGAMSYAAKYMDKTIDELPEEWGRPGRFWGVSGREHLPVGEVITTSLYYSEAVMLQRWVRRYAGLNNRDRYTETIFVNVPERWLDALDGLQDCSSIGVNREGRENDLI